MKFSTTLILLVVAVGLAIYIGVYERGEIRPPTTAGMSGKMLASIDPEEVGRIVIEAGEETVELQRHAIYWIFKEPIGDRASAQTVAAALDQLAHLAIQDELRPAEMLNSPELSDEALGFGTAETIRVSLYPESEGDEKPQPSHVVVLGKAAPISNTLYARILSDPERAALTYVVNGAPRQYLSSPIPTLRDRSLLGIPTEQIVRLVVRTASGEVEVLRKITPPQVGWTVTRPLQTRADTAMMEGFLSRLAGLQIADVIEEVASSPTLPSQIPSGAARIDLTVYGWDEPLSLYLSPKDDAAPVPDAPATPEDPQAPRLVARISSRPGVYEIRSPLLTDLPDTPTEFRDPYLARIPVQFLHSITIVSRTDPNVVLRSESSAEGVRWYSSRSGVKDKANLDRLKRMLNAINGGRVLDFIPIEEGELENYGLQSPELRIAFNFHPPKPQGEDAREPDGGEPAEIQQRIIQFGRTDENTLFANFVGEPWVYQVDPAIRSSIPSHPLKWRDLKVKSFNLIGLKRIERKSGDKPLLTLNYEYAVDKWSGAEGGIDVTGRIDTSRTMAMARTLGSLKAIDWITNLQTAYQRLDTPSLEISVTRREIDPLTNTMVNVNDQLRFSKAPVGGYYGNVVGTPDVFLVAPETYRDLLAPMLKP